MEDGQTWGCQSTPAAPRALAPRIHPAPLLAIPSQPNTPATAPPSNCQLSKLFGVPLGALHGCCSDGDANAGNENEVEHALCQRDAQRKGEQVVASNAKQACCLAIEKHKQAGLVTYWRRLRASGHPTCTPSGTDAGGNNNHFAQWHDVSSSVLTVVLLHGGYLQTPSRAMA